MRKGLFAIGLVIVMAFSGCMTPRKVQFICESAAGKAELTIER
jgi:hypothetical protein